jgi:proprotein convertase subtilisin/kexin type 5
MPASTPRLNSVPFSRFGFTLFYLKTWSCPTNYFFNITTNLCDTCSIPNCATCSNLDQCSVCNTGFDLTATAIASAQCTSCALEGCLNCKSSTICDKCDSAKNYFLDKNAGMCILCTLSNCLDCLNLTTCSTCDTPNNYFLVQGSCVGCDIPYCIQCSSLTACTTCD